MTEICAGGSAVYAKLMHCPFCNHEETKVIDSRLAGEGQQIRRRRECLQCGERFTTFETAELVMPRIVKSDASREPFDESKLRSSMLKALEKRPVSSEALDAAVVHICHKLRTLGEREVHSRLVGELAMEELHNLDEVAYVRFASVYRSFQDVDAFREEIERMRSRRSREAAEGQLALWTGRSRQEAMSAWRAVRRADDAPGDRARAARSLHAIIPIRASAA